MTNLTIDPNVYSGTKIIFNLFRKELAVAAEIIVPESYFGVPDDGIDWKHISKLTDFFGYWKEQPKDSIWYLLAHSDHTGFIKWEHAGDLGNRIKALQLQLPGKDLYPNWQKFAGDFSKQVLLAHLEKKDIIFK